MNVTFWHRNCAGHIGAVLKKIDDFVWGIPLIVLILAAAYF